MTVEYKDGLTPMLDRLRAKLPDALARGLIEAGQHSEFWIRRVLFDTAKGGIDRTGVLARSFQTSLVSFKGEPAAASVSDVIYARIQDIGGIVRARIAPMLRFRVDTNVWVTTKQVRIPARHYTTKAAEKADPGVGEILDARAQSTIDEADHG